MALCPTSWPLCPTSQCSAPHYGPLPHIMASLPHIMALCPTLWPLCPTSQCSAPHHGLSTPHHSALPHIVALCPTLWHSAPHHSALPHIMALCPTLPPPSPRFPAPPTRGRGLGEWAWPQLGAWPPPSGRGLSTSERPPGGSRRGVATGGRWAWLQRWHRTAGAWPQRSGRGQSASQPRPLPPFPPTSPIPRPRTAPHPPPPTLPASLPAPHPPAQHSRPLRSVLRRPESAIRTAPLPHRPHRSASRRATPTSSWLRPPPPPRPRPPP